MSKTPTSGERQALSIRLPLMMYAWLGKRAYEDGLSINDLINQLIADIRSWFGLPKNIVDRIEADRSALGMTQREYLIHLIGSRYEALLKAELEQRPGKRSGH
jgi:hypothetical protein